MSRRKKKEHHEEHVDESWLIPYADLLTLLLALFIVLFSMSSVDAKKFQAMSEVFNEAFTSGTGIFDYPSPMPQNQMDSVEEAEDEEEKQEEQTEEKLDQEAKIKIDQQELKTIQQKVNSYIQKNNLKNQLDTSLTGEGLLVTIRDNVLFQSGSADVRKEDLKIAKEISELLVMDPVRNIIISGHTDNVPISNARYESNWELSVMRAVNFMKIVLQNKDLDPRWFSAKGFGEFQPAASNGTKEGRAQNRRVEILILPLTSSQT
ncbi:flagellar motor protein MotB [Cytobacillus spongiae]|uniref:flagellar motor protein MotB n=1 Tax=Cytobacillus spongiae TaxID=2901381 RepID=UPI001F305F6C|nr:flagellar motor protein MotB [Cytobacillus spongiae]UII56506.1 flagellar motor protein MotB [Cytobacillus spongiae]